MTDREKEYWDWLEEQTEEVQIMSLYPEWKFSGLTPLEFGKKLEKEERERDLVFAKERVEDLTLEIAKLEKELDYLKVNLKEHMQFINENKPQGELFVTS